MDGVETQKTPQAQKRKGGMKAMEKEKAGMSEPSNTEKEEPAKEVALKKEETEKKKPSNIAKKGPAEGDAIEKEDKEAPETEKKGAAARE